MGLRLRPHTPPAIILNYPCPQNKTTTASTSQPLPTGLRAIVSICHTKQSLTHCLPQPGTFLQRFSLAWGEDSPIPVASPWMGTPRSLRATMGSVRNWNQNS